MHHLASALLHLLVIALSYDSSYIVSESSESPCPKVFHFDSKEFSDDYLFARLTVPYPRNVAMIHTCVMLTVSKGHKVFKGEIIPTKNKSVIVSEILDKKIEYLQFNLTFPRVEPTPLLGLVVVNRIVICKGPIVFTDSDLTSTTLCYLLEIDSNNTYTKNDASLKNDKSNTQNISKLFSGSNDDLDVKLLRGYLVESDKFSGNNLIDLRVNLKNKNNSVESCVSYKRGVFQWIVAVYIKSKLGVQYQCAANLITSQHVILAAHCIQETRGSFYEKNTIVLFFGKTSLNSWEENIQSRELADIFVHPDFDHYSFTSDISVLKFSKNIEFSETISPICFWKPNDNINPTTVGMVVGWGMNPKAQNFVPNYLRSAIIKLIPWELCIQDREFFYITSRNTLCAVSIDGTGPCNGDSGAGFVILDTKTNQWYLRALVSLAMVDGNTQKCDLNRSVVLTNVDKYTTWIQNTLLL